MIANVHYVPVQWDLSDLLDKIKYLKEHDEWARNITKNANEFAMDSKLCLKISSHKI